MKINPKIQKFITSTFIVTVISVLGGITGYLLNSNFWAFFILFFILQYVIFFVTSTIIESFFVEKTKQKELDKLENLSTILNCAYCNQANLMTFLPENNNRIEFTCESCKKKNLVTMQFVVARLTEPVVIPKVSGIPLESA
jgi:hypothetical protein